ncbi:MAG: hypothetical protein J0M35_10575 [Candidatus Obscuribacter phosphatis]|uniref:Tetratricopeptide repeat protein n=1 Tax=Candidatus Obscuribacter phosphatis TaxID=1906157 RepID=A0A8J7TMG2_9BACT|nr:hypothetical protein [Candidatus Obscuribacter phosphatis]
MSGVTGSVFVVSVAVSYSLPGVFRKISMAIELSRSAETPAVSRRLGAISKSRIGCLTVFFCGAALAFSSLVLSCWQTAASAAQLEGAGLEFKDALAAYEKNPTDHRSVYNLAALTSQLGDREQALPLFEKAVDLDSEDFYSHLGLCQSLAIEYLVDKKDGVAEAFQSEQKWKRVLHELKLAETLLWQDRWLSAGRRMEALVLLCKTQMQLHQFDRALLLLQKVRSQKPFFLEGSSAERSVAEAFFQGELKEYELICRFAGCLESESGTGLRLKPNPNREELMALSFAVLNGERKLKSPETLRVILGGIVLPANERRFQASGNKRLLYANKPGSPLPSAKLLALAARQIETSFPNDAALWLLLARLEGGAAAEKHYRRALALKKDSLAGNLGLSLLLAKRSVSAARTQLAGYRKLLSGLEPGADVIIADRTTAMALSLLPSTNLPLTNNASRVRTVGGGTAFALPLQIVRLDCGCSLGSALLQLSRKNDLAYLGLQARQGGLGLAIFTAKKAALAFSKYEQPDLTVSAIEPARSGLRRIADFSELADAILTFQSAFYLPALELGNADFPPLPLAI